MRKGEVAVRVLIDAVLHPSEGVDNGGKMEAGLVDLCKDLQEPVIIIDTVFPDVILPVPVGTVPFSSGNHQGVFHAFGLIADVLVV